MRNTGLALRKWHGISIVSDLFFFSVFDVSTQHFLHLFYNFFLFIPSSIITAFNISSNSRCGNSFTNRINNAEMYIMLNSQYIATTSQNNLFVPADRSLLLFEIWDYFKNCLYQRIFRMQCFLTRKSPRSVVWKYCRASLKEMSEVGVKSSVRAGRY